MARPALRPDIASAVRRSGGATRGCGRELRVLEAHLLDGERVRRVAGARYGRKIGLLVLTGRRLLFLVNGWFAKAVVEFPVARISQVSWHSGYGAGELFLNIDGLREEITSIGTCVGERIAADLGAALARIDDQRAAALDRSAALYAMVEDLHSLHFAPADAGELAAPETAYDPQEVLAGA